MYLPKIVFAAAAVNVVKAQSQSICDKYTTVLLKENTPKNQYTLLTLLVNTAGIGNYTGPGTSNPSLPGSMVAVPGILAPGTIEGEQVSLMPYFNGALMSTNRNGVATSVNFLDGGGADPIIANPTSSGADGSNQQKLFLHLYQFFGKLLGCSGYGTADFPGYMGAASQYQVHRFMNLDHAQNSWFIQQVGLAAKSFGASDEDIMTVAQSLQSAFNYRCSPASAVIPEQGPQLNSMCQNATCPLDPASTCPAYPNGGVGMNPAAAEGMSGGQMGGMPSAAPITQISDSQPQAPTSAPAVTQISDGQPQAPTMAGTPAASSPRPMYTGAAAAMEGKPFVAAGLAGLAVWIF